MLALLRWTSRVVDLAGRVLGPVNQLMVNYDPFVLDPDPLVALAATVAGAALGVWLWPRWWAWTYQFTKHHVRRDVPVVVLAVVGMAADWAGAWLLVAGLWVAIAAAGAAALVFIGAMLRTGD